MNVKLLRKIAKVIQNKPWEFDMQFWHRDPITRKFWGTPTKAAKACGTTHCFAGWAHLLDGRFPRTATIDAATQILALTEEQRYRLFFSDNWPEEFCEGFTDNGEQLISARVAAARIEHFIATEGRE